MYYLIDSLGRTFPTQNLEDAKRHIEENPRRFTRVILHDTSKSVVTPIQNIIVNEKFY